jgi:hypothetical protein
MRLSWHPLAILASERIHGAFSAFLIISAHAQGVAVMREDIHGPRIRSRSVLLVAVGISIRVELVLYALKQKQG